MNSRIGYIFAVGTFVPLAVEQSSLIIRYQSDRYTTTNPGLYAHPYVSFHTLSILGVTHLGTDARL